MGTTLAAELLAACLAHTHGKRVLLIGRQTSRQRLPRHLDLALPMATRPQTWKLVQRGATDIRALLVAAGALDALTATSVSLQMDTEAGAAFGSHLAHAAAGFGLRVRRQGERWQLSRVPALRGANLETRLHAWLSAIGVERADRDTVQVTFGDRGVELARASGPIEGAQIVLADDDALLEMPEEDRRVGLHARSMTVTLTARIQPLPAPVSLFPDRGVSILQQPQRQALVAITGDDAIEARAASTLGGPFPVRRLATSRYHALSSGDGAPMIGPLAAGGAFAIGGMGDAAAFAMPSLARVLVGAADDAEAAWFAAHAPGADRAHVAELAL